MGHWSIPVSKGDTHQVPTVLCHCICTQQRSMSQGHGIPVDAAHGSSVRLHVQCASVSECVWAPEGPGFPLDLELSSDAERRQLPSKKHKPPRNSHHFSYSCHFPGVANHSCGNDTAGRERWGNHGPFSSQSFLTQQ